MRFFTENGNEYKTTVRNSYNRIHHVDRSGGGYSLKFVSSVPRGIYGDSKFDPQPNRDAHQQIRSAIESHAGSPIIRESVA
jgi:hypothetical protein